MHRSRRHDRTFAGLVAPAKRGSTPVVALAVVAAGAALAGLASFATAGAASPPGAARLHASPGAMGSTRGVAPALPACATSTLVVWLDTMANGAAGSFFYSLELTNLSTRACALTGYPGVSAVGLNGAQVGPAASRDPVHRRATVDLAPGAAAMSVLRITDVLNYPTSRCGPVLAAGLRVYPPDQTASKVVPYPFRACTKATAPFLSVETVQRS